MTAPPAGGPRAKVEHLDGTEWQKARSFCPAGIPECGRTVWPAGPPTPVPPARPDIPGNPIYKVTRYRAKAVQRDGGMWDIIAAPITDPAMDVPCSF